MKDILIYIRKLFNFNINSNYQNEYLNTIELKRQIFKNNNLKIINSAKQMNKLNEDAKIYNLLENLTNTIKL